MKICLLYTRVIKNHDPNWKAPLPYDQSAVRFLQSYLQHRPKIPHELIVANCGGEGDSMFDQVAIRFYRDDGGGYDCGTYQAIGSKLDCDFVLGLNSHCHFWRDGWLEQFAEAFSVFGKNTIYGASGSYERNRHIRTPAIAFTPEIMSQYPQRVNDRKGAEEFEQNFTIWAESKGYMAIVVATDGNYTLSRIKAIKAGFRRGDQSNMLIKDRHVLVYDSATPEMKAHLESVTYSNAPEIL